MRFLLILLLLLITFVPRFWNFWTIDFTGDEATHVKKAVTVAVGFKNLATLDNVSTALKNIYIPILEHNHPPLEFLILIPFGLIEPREFFARLVYVVLGSLALILSYFFTRNIFDKRLAGYFFIFFGTSAYAIWWSQTAIYINFAIAFGVFITLSIVNFYKNPSHKSLLFLALSEAFGLYVFLDFIFYLPSIIWLIWNKRRLLKKNDLVLPIVTFLILTSIFYAPYLTYSLLGGPQFAGFNYVLNDKLAASPDVLRNLKGYWNNFIAYPGVFILFPFVFLALSFVKKLRYFKYLFLVIIIYFSVFILKSPTPFHYLASTLGIFLILASEGIDLIKPQLRAFVVIFIITVNFIGFHKIFTGQHNPQLFDDKSPNNAKAISTIAKKCVTLDDETYISTDDPWKTGYYFGRHSTVEKDGVEARIETIEEFLNGKLTNIVLVHIRKDLVDQSIQSSLKAKAVTFQDFNDEVVYLYKEC